MHRLALALLVVLLLALVVPASAAPATFPDAAGGYGYANRGHDRRDCYTGRYRDTGPVTCGRLVLRRGA